MIKILRDEREKSKICESILRDLPEWFGIEEALVNYTKEVKDMIFFCAYDDTKPVGFIAIKVHSKDTAEVYVMGILETHQRRGIGKKLIEGGQNYCKEEHMTFLTVKTLDESRPNKAYDQTREFYRAMGFKPLEVFKTLWDESNPCLFMAKVL